MNWTDAHETLLQLVLDADREGAVAFVSRWAKDRSYAEAVRELLQPVLQRFGKLWSSDEEISLAQGYMSGKIAEDIMLLAATERRGAPMEYRKGPVVIRNIEDDYHELGRKLVGIFLESEGWEVVDLGNDVLPEAFVDAAEANGARVIGASAMMYTHALNIRKLREEIDRRGLTGRIQLAVGGAVFNEHLVMVEKVGGDGTAPNAIEAVSLFDRLWEASLALESGS